MEYLKSITKKVMTIIFSFALLSCSNEQAKLPESELEVIVLDEVVEVDEVDVWLIDEHQINSIAVTSKAKDSVEAEKESKSREKKNAVKEVAEESSEELAADTEELYEIASLEAIEAQLAEEEYEARQIVEVTETIIPLEETQTVVSYNKKGNELASFQVISNPDNNEIEQIIFTDKKHKDVYDVQAGMSGKEVKRLRKELKHMKKKGQVFYYDDTSNIMYLMTATDRAGDEYTEGDIETMEVQAIIWKDKRHHKKHKK